MRVLSIVCLTFFAFHLPRAQSYEQIVEENGKWYILGTDGTGGTTTTEMTNAVSQGTPDGSFKNDNEQDISDEKLVQVSDSSPEKAQQQAQQLEVPQEKTGGRLNWWSKSSKPQTIEDELAMRKNTQQAFQKVFNAQTQPASAPAPLRKISLSSPYEPNRNPAEEGLPQEKTGGRFSWWGKQPASKPIEDELAVRRNTNDAFQKIFNTQTQSAPASASLQKIAFEPKRNPAEESNSDGKIFQLSDSDPNEPQQQAQQFEQVPEEKTKDRRFNWWGQKSGPKPIEDELTVRRNTQEAYQKVFNAQTQSASAPAPLPKIAISPPYEPNINPAEQQAARELAPLRRGKDNGDENLSQVSGSGDAQQLDAQVEEKTGGRINWWGNKLATKSIENEAAMRQNTNEAFQKIFTAQAQAAPASASLQKIVYEPKRNPAEEQKTGGRLNWWGQKSGPKPIEDELAMRKNTQAAFQKVFNAPTQSAPAPASPPQIAISPPYKPKRKPAEEMNDNQESSAPAPKQLPNIAISPVYEPQRKNIELVSTDDDVPPLKQALDKSDDKLVQISDSDPDEAQQPAQQFQVPEEKTGGRLNWWSKSPAPKPIEAELSERQNTHEAFQKIFNAQAQSAPAPAPLPKIAISPPYEPKRKPIEERRTGGPDLGLQQSSIDEEMALLQSTQEYFKKVHNNQESSAPAPKPLPQIGISPVYEPPRKNIELPLTKYSSDERFLTTQSQTSPPFVKGRPIRLESLPNDEEVQYSVQMNNYQASSAPQPLPKIGISPVYKPKSKPLESRPTGGSDLGVRQDLYNPPPAPTYQTVLDRRAKTSKAQKKPTMTRYAVNKVYRSPDEMFLMTQSEAKRKMGPVVSGLGPAPQFETSRPIVDEGPLRYRLESLPDDEKVQDERQILQQTRLRQSQWPPGPQIQPTMQTRVEQSQYEPVQQYSRWQPQIQPLQQYREEQPQYPPVRQYREEQPQYPPVRQSRLQQPHYAHYV